MMNLSDELTLVSTPMTSSFCQRLQKVTLCQSMIQQYKIWNILYSSTPLFV
jgi:hypothetical protein